METVASGSDNRLKGIIFTASSGIMYGTLPVFANIAYGAGCNTATFNLYKSVLAIPFLLLIIIATKRKIILPLKHTLLVLLVGLLGKGLTSLLLFSSYLYVDGGVATALHFTHPLFVALLEWVIFRKLIKAYKLAMMIVASTAVALFIEAGVGGNVAMGAFLAILSAVVYALFIIMIDKTVVSEIDTFVFALYCAISGSVFSVAFGLVTGSLLPPVPTQMFWGGICAFVTSVLAVSFFKIGIMILGDATASFFTIFEPVSGCILGIIFLNEIITGRKMIGILLIVLAVGFTIYMDYRSIKKEDTP